MMRKVRSEPAEAWTLRRAEKHKLGLPNINRHSNFLYFSYDIPHFFDTCKMRMLYENVHGKYMKVTAFYNNINYKILSNYGVFDSLASGFSCYRKIQKV